jgi:hypothetical protein
MARTCDSHVLIERKRMLQSIMPDQPSVLLYACHIAPNGKELPG